MTTARSGWEKLAEWYDAKQGDNGDLWHRALIDPTLFRILGSVQGHDVLDLACGNGYISRKMAREGARVTGVDASEPVIELARMRERQASLGIKYNVCDAAALSPLTEGSFDAAVCNMALMDIPRAKEAVSEVSRVLRPGGRFVFSISHPCFDIPNASGWALERMGGGRVTLWRKVSRYREVFSDWFYWIVNGSVHRTRAHHRPLSWYFRSLKEAGLAVESFEEPEPTSEFLENDDEGGWIAQIPLHCVIEARKLATSV